MKELSNEEYLEQEVFRLLHENAILETEVIRAREEKNKQDTARLEMNKKREQEIERLERLILTKDDAFDQEQGKRLKRTFFVLCGVIYAILIYFALEEGINISDIKIDARSIFYSLGCLVLGVPFSAGLIMFVSLVVMYYIFGGAIKRAEAIARLKGELDAIQSTKKDV